MPQISRSALVMFSAERMYDLVNDVRAYPEFLPWCGQTEVIEDNESEMVARICVKKGAVNQSFVTKNSLIRPSEIRLTLVEGPFRWLKGSWHFHALDATACKVELILDFELKRAFAGMALGAIFSQATSTMVDAFCKRAHHLYGNIPSK